MAFAQDHAAPAADGGSPRISVRSLTISFERRGGGGRVTPVNNISLDVAAEEMLVLLGPSGCGKTTLLRCIAGLERPHAGEIVINGQVVFSSAKGVFLPPNRRPISMVYQSYALWPHMTVFENVAYPLQSRRVRGAEVTERVNKALSLVELTPLAKQYPAQISGGQQQRVALARAVVSGTGVVLFDEPLSNVDAKVREQLRSEILRMQRSLGFSALYVTHDQVEAMGIGDRVAVLRDGHIDQIGTPEEVYLRPASRSVGAFIGSPNILSGDVVEVHSGHAVVRTGAGALRIDLSTSPSSIADTLKVGQSVAVLARPETVRIGTPKDDGSENHLTGKVESRMFLGAYTEYVLAIGDVRLRSWSFNDASILRGTDTSVSIAPADIVMLGDQS
jgi:iron(III) transport system ATP-binding protein